MSSYICEKIKFIIEKEMGFNQVEIYLFSSLINDLEFDYLDLLELILLAEIEFRIKIGENSLKSISTVSDLCYVIRIKLKE